MVAETLSRLGASVSDSARPAFDLIRAQNNYQTLLTAVMTGALSDEDVAKAEAVADSLDPDDMSNSAVTARATVLPHRDWIRANTQREKLRAAWDAFFDDWDILLCPQMATPAFPHDHRPFGERTIQVDNEEQPYFPAACSGPG